MNGKKAETKNAFDELISDELFLRIIRTFLDDIQKKLHTDKIPLILLDNFHFFLSNDEHSKYCINIINEILKFIKNQR